jgi:hypothetical protein
MGGSIRGSANLGVKARADGVDTTSNEMAVRAPEGDKATCNLLEPRPGPQ